MEEIAFVNRVRLGCRYVEALNQTQALKVLLLITLNDIATWKAATSVEHKMRARGL